MLTYLVDGSEFATAEEAAEFMIDDDYIEESEYDDLLDDCYGDVTVGALSYPTSDVLRHVDPVAYRCGYLDYASDRISELRDEVISELEGMDDGDELSLHGFDIECHDPEEYEDEAETSYRSDIDSEARSINFSR